MPKLTAEDLLERAVTELKEKESEKKKELSEIQKDLRKKQKALEFLIGTSPSQNKKPKSNV